MEAKIGDTGKTHRFLDLNDCHTLTEELPQNIDVLALQFSGAMWYPHCYDFPDCSKRALEVLDVLENLVEDEIQNTGARYYIPSAGVPVILDPTPEGNSPVRFNELGNGTTIYPQWEAFAKRMDFAKRLPSVEVLRVFPGDQVRTYVAGDKVNARTETFTGGEGEGKGLRPASATWLTATEERLREYSQERSNEWGQLWNQDVKPVTTDELLGYFMRLHSRNRRMIMETQWAKKLRIGILGKDGESIVRSWSCHLGSKGPRIFEELRNGNDEASFKSEYSFELCEFLLRLIVDEKESWENVLASLRVRLRRYPNLYDTAFMIFMRYGDHAEIPQGYAKQMREQRTESMEMIELPGLPPGVRIQRYCPHMGGDLAGARVANGVIVCPRHGWKFCSESGKCISGGKEGLRMEKIEW